MMVRGMRWCPVGCGKQVNYHRRMVGKLTGIYRCNVCLQEYLKEELD